MGMKAKKMLTDKERVEFTKGIEYLFEASYANWKRVLLMSFLKGVATGLGVFLGGTIVVGLLLWLLSGLGQLPFINDISESAKSSIDQGNK